VNEYSALERDFQGMGPFHPMEVWVAQYPVLVPPIMVSMSPPGYLLAWLRPGIASFPFTRKDRCSYAPPSLFSTFDLPVFDRNYSSWRKSEVRRNSLSVLKEIIAFPL
jgi:hypothetical protein